MRELAERTIENGHIIHGAPARKAGRSVSLNLAESPLGWLYARKLVTPRQFEAGERLRADYETASLGARVTMRWDASPSHRRNGGPGEPLDPTLAQISAKRRFDAAIAAAGPGLSDILWRVICACEGIPAAERALGWPARAGKLVLTLALDRIADHYQLR
ncbi:DUF6456 domain-containing protein [Sphingomonas sp. MG17]|uniref:DUF6456 domain-containing protein n=1 Tax=Sphingomonas tagetis TaxID=2949092 RepID=A0A9X2HQZ5_9SPHN|nr:DUF6456 domain-containing protein [Sphingomonas tagetis]MCP3731974.1 DUF6456 domain-containing protein [Sphingomonas tagetis]